MKSGGEFEEVSKRYQNSIFHVYSYARYSLYGIVTLVYVNSLYNISYMYMMHIYR